MTYETSVVVVVAKFIVEGSEVGWPGRGGAHKRIGRREIDQHPVVGYGRQVGAASCSGAGGTIMSIARSIWSKLLHTATAASTSTGRPSNISVNARRSSTAATAPCCLWRSNAARMVSDSENLTRGLLVKIWGS